LKSIPISRRNTYAGRGFHSGRRRVGGVRGEEVFPT